MDCRAKISAKFSGLFSMAGSPRSKNKIARFGIYEVDFERFILKKGGLRVKLQDQPFQILGLLLERPGDIVTRDEIRQELWPDNTFVEFDGGLNTAVKKLRTALNDSADTPRFIETIPRKGYRFLVPVEFSENSTNPQVLPLPEPNAVAEIVAIKAAPAQADPAESFRFAGPKLWNPWLAGGVSLLLVAAGYLALRGGKANSPIRSIAILPLQNLSAQQGEDYFSDGMTDEIITDLAKIRSLRVISRTSVMRYKGASKSIPEVARELQVDAELEGSISRSTDRVHIRAQLIRASPEEHIWAESYDRPVADEVTVQGELDRK